MTESRSRKTHQNAPGSKKRERSDPSPSSGYKEFVEALRPPLRKDVLEKNDPQSWHDYIIEHFNERLPCDCEECLYLWRTK